MRQKKNKKSTVILSNQTSADGERSVKQKKRSRSILYFDEIYENGLIRDGERYILCYEFSDLDYLMFSDNKKDSVYEQYQNLLNTLPCDMTYQELLMNREYDSEALYRAMLPDSGSSVNSEKLRILSEDFRKIQQKRIKMCVEKECWRVRIGVLGYTPAGKLDSPDTVFQYYEEIEKALDEMGVKSKILKPEDVLKIYHDIYIPNSLSDFRLPENIYRYGMSLSNYVAPSHLRTDAIKYIETGSMYSRVIYVKSFARDIDDQFITDMLDHRYHIAISKHIRRLDKNESAKLLKNQLDSLEGQMEKRREINHKRGTDYIPYRLRDKEKELERVQSKLAGTNCDLFEACVFFYLSADTREKLEDLTNYLKNLARKHQCNIDTLTRQQEKGLQAILPLAYNPFNETKNDNINMFWLTDELANLIPFSSVDYIDENGLCYGRKNKSNKLVIIDRGQELNANGFVFGASGSGKSFFVKLAEFIPAMLKYTNDEFIIIDPDNEYKPLIEPFGGTIVTVAPDSPTYLNLFDADLSYNENGITAVSIKKEFIMMFIEQVKGESLNASERSMVNRCITIAYKDFVESNGTAPLPTLQNFWGILKDQKSEISDKLCDELELYVSGSFDMFAHETNVDYGNRFMLFDITNMGAQLKIVGMQIILELLWQRVRKNKQRGVRTWVWTDEFTIMLNDENSSAFFETVYQRIRKQGGVATGIAQNISAAMTNSHAMNMLKNSEFVCLLRQKEDDLKYILENYNLSQSQIKSITSDQAGHGIIIAGNKVIEFENTLDKNTELYKLCSTKFGEDNGDKIENGQQRKGA